MPYIKVSATDKGIGMDEATHRQIFDPLFTIRARSRGANRDWRRPTELLKIMAVRLLFIVNLGGA